jgi:hypothetical protein
MKPEKFVRPKIPESEPEIEREAESGGGWLKFRIYTRESWRDKRRTGFDVV